MIDFNEPLLRILSARPRRGCRLRHTEAAIGRGWRPNVVEGTWFPTNDVVPVMPKKLATANAVVHEFYLLTQCMGYGGL